MPTGRFSCRMRAARLIDAAVQTPDVLRLEIGSKENVVTWRGDAVVGTGVPLM